MTARLPLAGAVAPWTAAFAGAAPVLWLGMGAPPGWDGGLGRRLAEEQRRWSPTMQAVPVPGPSSVANPWAFRADRQAALRWGELAADLRTLDELGGPPVLGGLVLEDVLSRLGSAGRRALLTQAAARMPPGTPFAVVERNGRSARHVARRLRGGEAEPALAAEELRRPLEVVGLGIEQAGALPSGRLRALLGPDLGARWWLITGRRA